MCLLILVNAAIARDTLWIMDITNHGTSYPKYASNSEYDVTGNSYPKNGELSPQGIKELYSLGQEFRKEYVTKQKFMSPTYDPSSVYLHSMPDQSALMSAYSFILGAYGDDIAYLNLNMENAMDHQKLVRKTLGLSETPTNRRAAKVDVVTDDGFMYWKDAAKSCPAIHSKVQSHIASASDALRSEYQTKLYPALSEQFKKPKDRFTFSSTHFYLDDYLAAKKFGLNVPKFSDQATTDKLIDLYEGDYYYNGMMGGNEISRVVATPLINYLLLNTFAKGEIARGTIKDTKLSALKHSHFFADEVSFAAFLKAIGYPQTSAPQGGQNIRFELFTTNKAYYVRGSLDGKPLTFGDSKKGIFELDSLLKTIYPLMYFGNVDDVCAGREDISLNIYPKCQNYQEYLMMHITQLHVANPKVVTKCHLSEKVVTVPVRRPERTVEHKVDLINVGFVEIVQIPHQKCAIDTRIVERTVPVIEEKIVVHEVEKLITERPTHIHHIVIDTPEKPAGIPAVFMEEAPAAGFPWWLWLLPLLCYIPCLALLCCRKKKPAPKARPKQPMAPVMAKSLAKPKEKAIMHIETQERHSPERKFVIEKKVVDEAEDIELEITKELQKSRVIRESHNARAVSHGRHTAAELAAESALSRGSGGGRRRRIKTIKKFGQVIGREEQILDEDGNVIRVDRIGLDENEAQSDHHLRSGPDVAYARSASGDDYHSRGADGADHYFKETYEKEVRSGAGSTSHQMMEQRQSRRGFSSGRHIEGGGYGDGYGEGGAGFAEGGAGSSSLRVRSGNFRSAEGSGSAGIRGAGSAGLRGAGSAGIRDVNADVEAYGHYSPGGNTRQTRGEGAGRNYNRFDDDDDY